MLKDCIDCGDEFEAREGYEVRCFSCWKAWKIERGEFVAPRRSATPWRTQSQTASLTEQVRQLEADLAHATATLRAEATTSEELRIKVRQLEQNLRDAELALASAKPFVAGLKEQLPRLIQLAHPDRHGGSPASKKATQWLLSLRENRP